MSTKDCKRLSQCSVRVAVAPYIENPETMRGFAAYLLLLVLTSGTARDNSLPLRRWRCNKNYPISTGTNADRQQMADIFSPRRLLYDQDYRDYDDDTRDYSNYDRRPTSRIFSEILEPEIDKRTLSEIHERIYKGSSAINGAESSTTNGVVNDNAEQKETSKSVQLPDDDQKGSQVKKENTLRRNKESPGIRTLSEESNLPNVRILEDLSEIPTKRNATVENNASAGKDGISNASNDSSPIALRYTTFFNDPFLWRMPEVPSRKSLGKKSQKKNADKKSRSDDVGIVKRKSKSSSGGPTIYAERANRRLPSKFNKYKGIDRKPRFKPSQIPNRPEKSSIRSSKPTLPEKKPDRPRKTEPEMISLMYDTVIYSRYVKTTTCGCVTSYGDTRTININFILPRAALITNFETTVDGKTVSSSIQEINSSKNLPKAKVIGEDIGTFLVETRDCDAVTLSVVVPQERTLNYTLTYEYIVPRDQGLYSVPIILHNNRWIEDLTVNWQIFEERNITDLRVPFIYKTTGLPALNTEDPIVCVNEDKGGSMHLTWAPRIDEQRNLSRTLGPLSKDGLVGILLLQYDVDHTQDPCGQVVKKDGYFAQFFAAPDQPPLAKHVVFILDLSDSMQGEPIKHLKQAMVNILDTLQDVDNFTLIDFSDEVEIININNRDQSILYRGVPPGVDGRGKRSGKTPWPGTLWTYQATPENVAAAKDAVMTMQLRTFTNIYDALIMGYKAIKDVAAYPPEPTGQSHPEPIIIFLTDGQPSDGPSYNPDIILKMVEDQNHETQATIFALGFGPEADMGLLRRLALATNGIEKHIYKDSDSAEQLVSFFQSIKSPVFKNLHFKYNSKQVVTSTLTQQLFPVIYKGKEVVVASKLHSPDIGENDLYTDIMALGRYAIIRCEHMTMKSRKSSGATSVMINYSNYTALRSLWNTQTQYPRNTVERIWAYLMLHQLRDAAELDHLSTRQETLCDDQLKPNYRMLEIALRLNYAMPMVTNLIYDGTVVERISVCPEPNDPLLTTKASPELDPLQQFSWLLKMRDRHGFAKLPLSRGKRGRMYTYLSLGISEHPYPRRSCPEASDGYPGECRYLPECPDPRVLGTPEKFRKHFCRLGSYAGVCCSLSFRRQIQPVVGTD